MGKLNAHVHHFASGEVSVAAMARIDHEKLRLAAEVQENLFPHVIGKGQVRPGTGYLGVTSSSNKARMLKFVKSITDTALIECTDSLARFWVDDALVTRGSVTSTVSNSDFSTASATITMTIASPGVVTWTGSNFSAGQPVSFSTDGALPTGVTAGQVYYVISTGLTADAFQFSATAGGAAVNTSGSQSGTHTGHAGWGLNATSGASASATGGVLDLNATARGSSTIAKQAVATSSTGAEHALRVVITQGAALFRCGSSDGGAEYISETLLGVGTHSLAFTPSASPYYIQFSTRNDIAAKIDSCSVESSGVLTLPAPWSEADLPLIRYDQSGDVLFLACASWQQRKIERRASGRSWSIVKYESDDGPFVTANTNGIRLTPGAAYGVTTLTASAGVFTSDHVGALIRVFPTGQSFTFNLAAEDQYTEAVRLSGVGVGNSYTYAVTGTWSGTLSRQHSYDGDEDTGFVTFGTITANASGTESVGTDHDNVIFYARWGFEVGNYTSGVATVTVSNSGGGRAGVFRIVGYSSPTSVDVQVLSPPGKLDSTDNWSFGAWSEINGWPSAVAFFDGRLWWGGEDRFWGSESDDFYAFNLDDEGDAGSIQRALATGGSINTVQWFLPLQRLIIGSTGAEISVRSSSFDEPLTPTNVTLKDASTHGAAAYSPVKMDGRGLFIHRDGIRAFEVLYDIEGNDYRSNSVMLLNDTIGGDGFTGMTVQRSPESYIWFIRADGQCPVLLYDPKEKTAGWFRFIGAPVAAGNSVVEDVQVLPSSGQDRVYLVIKRTINGSTVRYLEKLAKHSEAEGGSTSLMADSYITAAGPVTTVTGLDHLEGETVVAWGTTGGVTGSIGTTYTVASGQITLPSSSTDVCVGLAYTWRYKSAKLAYGAQGGTALLMPKRVAEIGLLTANTHPNAIEYGSDFTDTYELPRVENSQNVSETAMRTVYDEATFPFGDIGFDTDSRVCLKGSAPYPATLLGLVLGVETNET